jgi:hypothetical protein
MNTSTPAPAVPGERERRPMRATAGWLMRKLMVLVGLLTTASLACLFSLGFLGMHTVVTDEGQVLYCDRVDVIYADDFDDQGRWLKGWHIYSCDGREVRTDEFSSEAADLGLR